MYRTQLATHLALATLVSCAACGCAQSTARKSTTLSTTQRVHDGPPATAAYSPGTVRGSTGFSDLPPSAAPGECFARVFVPAQYETVTEEQIKRQASQRIEVIPAKYEWVEEEVVVKEASTRLVEVPAEYDWAEQQVLVQEGGSRLEQVPAEYRYVDEQVLVTPATTEWKKGRGPVERVDGSTGEIMCLVEVPAVYKTVKRRDLVIPASVREISIPPVYDRVRKRVVVKPAEMREVVVPAETKSVRVRRLVQPATTQHVDEPAEYETTTRKIKIADGRVEWQQVICETNATPDRIARIQRALQSAGHNPGRTDGVLGPGTYAAVRSYQQANNLTTGGITYETLDHLGVR